MHIVKAGLTACMLIKQFAVQDDEEYDDDEDDEDDDEDEDDELARKDSGIIITELNHDGSDKLGTDVRAAPMLCVMSMRTRRHTSAAAK